MVVGEDVAVAADHDARAGPVATGPPHGDRHRALHEARGDPGHRVRGPVHRGGRARAAAQARARVAQVTAVGRPGADHPAEQPGHQRRDDDGRSGAEAPALLLLHRCADRVGAPAPVLRAGREAGLGGGPAPRVGGRRRGSGLGLGRGPVRRLRRARLPARPSPLVVRARPPRAGRRARRGVGGDVVLAGVGHGGSSGSGGVGRGASWEDSSPLRVKSPSGGR